MSDRKDKLPPSISHEEIIAAIIEGGKKDAARLARKEAEMKATIKARRARGEGYPTDGMWWPVEGFEDEIKEAMDAHVRNIEALKTNALFQTMPTRLREKLRDKKVARVSTIGKSPSEIIEEHSYAEPVHLIDAFEWIEGRSPDYRQARIELKDGDCIVFRPGKFESISQGFG